MLSIYIVRDADCTEDEYASYGYIVTIDHDVIARGRIEDHSRAAGWRELVRRVADEEGNA